MFSFIKFLLLQVVMSAYWALPAQLDSPNTITLVKGESRRKETVHNAAGQCLTLDSKEPTKVILSGQNREIESIANRQTGALNGYSSEYCEDDFNVFQQKLTEENPVYLNMRIPICSFRLGRNPWPGAPQLVYFYFEDKARPLEFTGVNDSCFDLCFNENDDQKNKFPTSVRIWETNLNNQANNYVRLFSERRCSDESEIKNAKGDSKMVASGTDLVQLTQTKPILRSIMVTKT